MAHNVDALSIATKMRSERDTENSAPILITTGEPAGIGPELVVQVLQHSFEFPLAVVGDAELLLHRAKLLGVDLICSDDKLVGPGGTATLNHVSMATPSVPGKPDSRNADYVIEMLNNAYESCRSGESAAIVTGPVQKSVIREAGHDFVGHTEFFAEKARVKTPVMMLVNDKLRVALATSHLPLLEVASALTQVHLESVLRVINGSLQDRFGIAKPAIGVCGLNPHAGESGHLGKEENEVIEPVLGRLIAEGIILEGPLPADAAFRKTIYSKFDVIVAMYHDQGLPVVKHHGDGFSVNVTLGLPFIRTSVDHGTALDIAGTGRAKIESLVAAMKFAETMSYGKN